MLNRLHVRLATAASLLAVATGSFGAPVLQSISPVAASYTFDSADGFTVANGSGFGDVTASLSAVDLYVPSPFPSASTSGCEAADFAGFVAGNIALIQRGTCNFDVKAQNAIAAGAAGVLFFNEGNPGRTDAIDINLGSYLAPVPVFFASFGIGQEFWNGISNGQTGYVIRMQVLQEDLAVPEPGTLWLLALGAGGLALWRRRRPS